MRLIKLADVKEYLHLLDREEISHSKFADLLNEAALKALQEHETTVIEPIAVGFVCLRCGSTYDDKYNPPCKCVIRNDTQINENDTMKFENKLQDESNRS
jgi:hypothetical protein